MHAQQLIDSWESLSGGTEAYEWSLDSLDRVLEKMGEVCPVCGFNNAEESLIAIRQGYLRIYCVNCGYRWGIEGLENIEILPISYFLCEALEKRSQRRTG